MLKKETGEMGFITNIQHYSVHDGPGIRTIIFIKGCPLACLWCSNPEGIGHAPEIAYYEKLCTRCYRCIEACPKNAIRKKEDGTLEFIRSLCTGCGKCADVCPTGARKAFGYYISVDEALERVNKDITFYRRSGGGLTLSGGECLVQAGFVMNLLEKAKEQYGLHTAIESSFYASLEVIKGVLRYVDFIFCDIKHMNPVRHQELTGRSNDLILENIRAVVDNLLPTQEMVLRFPLIPTINDEQENLTATARFIKSLNKDIHLEVLPYHEYGKGKYDALGVDYPLAQGSIQAPDKAYLDRIHELFVNEGVTIALT